MARYSHVRLRKALALARILTGVTFLVFGSSKISSLEFARERFPQWLWEVTHGGAIGFYGSFLNSFVWENPGKYGVMLGFLELFIGIGLLLGLAVRPVSFMGAIYSVNLMLATWMMPGPDQPLWRYLDGELRYITLLFLFLLFGLGHAGEIWGLGALYHRRRERWDQYEPSSPAEALERMRHPEDEEDEALEADALPRRTY